MRSKGRGKDAHKRRHLGQDFGIRQSLRAREVGRQVGSDWKTYVVTRGQRSISVGNDYSSDGVNVPSMLIRSLPNTSDFWTSFSPSVGWSSSFFRRMMSCVAQSTGTCVSCRFSLQLESMGTHFANPLHDGQARFDPLVRYDVDRPEKGGNERLESEGREGWLKHRLERFGELVFLVLKGRKVVVESCRPFGENATSKLSFTL